jgi:ABC-type Fe3+ transport system permease subunit
MLGKVVLTLVVIVIAILVIKQRKEAEARPAQKSRKAPAEAESSPPMASDLRTAAYMFLILMFGAGAIGYYFSWQDDHTVVTVNLFRDGQSEPATYQVYKFQLDSRSFTTTSGVRITVADSERMEVSGLESP